MSYAIVNSSGNVLEWFADERAALAALAEMIDGDADAVGHLDVVAFDASGEVADADPVSATVERLVWTAYAAIGQERVCGAPGTYFVYGAGLTGESGTNENTERVEVPA